MTKIEELKKAFEASTPGEWNLSKHATPNYAPQFGVYADGARDDLAIVRGESNAEFITLARNLMPKLLLVVEALAEAAPWLQAALDDEPDDEPDDYDNYALRELVDQVSGALENLK